MNKKHNQSVGKIGEETACMFLMKHGYQILTRNYWKKWGEIDIIAKKDSVTHFIEVKTVSKDFSLKLNRGNVSYETENCATQGVFDAYRPEDNIHPSKLKKLSRVIQTYLIEKDVTEEYEWQFDAVTVFLDTKNKLAKINHIKDIIL